MKIKMIIIINQSQKHDRGWGALNNDDGTGACKVITLIVVIGGGWGRGNKQTTDADTEIAINIAISMVISALYYLFMKILHTLILKPHTDLYVFIFGRREFQSMAQKKQNSSCTGQRESAVKVIIPISNRCSI